MRQLVDKLKERLPNARIASMTRYKDEHHILSSVHHNVMGNVMAEWISSQGLHQSHVAGNSSSYMIPSL